MEIVQKELENILQEFPAYCADFRNSAGQLIIDLDGDAGVDIGTISRISRKLNHFIEENNLAEQLSVEIGTAGVGNNFKDTRQYATNVGRHLEIKTADGSTMVGLLSCVSEKSIWLEINKSIKRIEKEEIDKSKVVIV